MKFAILLLAIPLSGATATFVKIDTTTAGSWKGVYGAGGYSIPGDSGRPAPYAAISVSAPTYTWAAATSDTRALQGTNSGRLATTWYSNGGPFSVDVNFTDGLAHQLALYLVDWDSLGRAQQFDVLDQGTGVVLDTRSLSAFSAGRYLVWTISGHVLIRVTMRSGVNAVVSGVFFEPGAVTLPSAPGIPGPPGVQGPQGAPGKDGASPFTKNPDGSWTMTGDLHINGNLFISGFTQTGLNGMPSFLTVTQADGTNCTITFRTKGLVWTCP